MSAPDNMRRRESDSMRIRMSLPFTTAKDELSLIDKPFADGIISVASKLAAIKANTGPITAAATRLVALTTAEIKARRLKISGDVKADVYFASAAFLTLLHEDIEGGVMNKDSSNSSSLVLTIDETAEVPEEALEVFRKRFAERSAIALMKALEASVSHLNRMRYREKSLSALSGRPNELLAEKQVLGKKFKADWSAIAGSLLKGVPPEELDGVERFAAQAGNDTEEDESEDTADDDPTAAAILAFVDSIDVADDSAATKVERTAEHEALIARVRSIIPAVKERCGSGIKFGANIVPNGIKVGIYTEKYNMPAKDGIFLPSIGKIGDVISIGDAGYVVFDGIYVIIERAVRQVSAAQARKTARAVLGEIYRPHASRHVDEFAVVLDDNERVDMFKNGREKVVLKKAYERGWDCLSLSSPNKPSAIWSPRAGFLRKMDDYAFISLKKATVHSARACAYELSANPLVAYTDPKRSTTTMWALTPDVTDGKQKVLFDVDLGGSVVSGQVDGIQPLTAFVNSEVVSQVYHKLSSTNKYVGNVEDAYLMSAKYYSTLRYNGEPLHGIIKVSQARNKGLVTSRYFTDVKVEGHGSLGAIELIGRADGKRKNKLGTQLVSASRLAAKMLGIERVKLVYGHELDVILALVKECERRTGFNPLDATIECKVNGNMQKIKHVVVGLYTALVDVSQTYDAHVTRNGFGANYMSARLTMEPTDPKLVALADSISANDHSRFTAKRALSNLRNVSALVGDSIIVSLGRFARVINKVQLAKYTSWFENHEYTHTVVGGFVEKDTKILNQLISAVGFNKLASAELDAANAEALMEATKVSKLLLPVGSYNGKKVELLIRLPEVSGVMTYQNATDDEKHYVVSSTMRKVFKLIAMMRTKNPSLRVKKVGGVVNELINHMKVSAYQGIKAPVAIPGLKGRASTKVVGDKDGFVIGKSAFYKLFTKPDALAALGLSAESVSSILDFADKVMLTDDNGRRYLTAEKAREFKRYIEDFLLRDTNSSKIKVMVQRSPTLNYVAYGYVEDVVGESGVISIPHGHGKRMAADDDGDPVRLIPVRETAKSFFDVLGEGTSTDRR